MKTNYKLYSEAMIRKFLDSHDMETRYPIRELKRWHTLICLSCPQGQKDFAERHNLDIENGTLTIPEFIDLVKDEHGAWAIKKMSEIMNEPQSEKPKIFGIWERKA